MPTRVDQQVEKLLAAVEARRRSAEAQLHEQGYDATAIKEALEEAKPLTPQSPHRGRAGRSVIEDAQLELFEQEGQGRFTSFPISPGAAFPSILTRLPVFVPGKRTNQRNRIDQDNALPFTTSWGTGRKHGPPLTVYDEDTLIALGRLRQKHLVGEGTALPIHVSDLYKRDDGVHVHALLCTIGQVQSVCGVSSGGQNIRLRLDSIKRLTATRIEFDTASAEKLISKGTTISLLDVLWQRYADEAVLYVQFSPVMACWFDDAYSYIDWNVRRQLTDTGKAVHRFLSGQPRRYEIGAQKLQTTIGADRRHKDFMGDLRASMADLKRVGWIKQWSIEGTGRRIPYKLVIRR